MKRCLILIALMLVLCTSACAEPEKIVFGTSEMGRDMVCYRVGKADAPRVLLLTFGIHAFEDAFPMDGRVLQDIAYGLIDYFDQHVDELGEYALYIIPAVNIDAMEEGVTHNGFGRTSAAGIDINRDFPTNWERIRVHRSRTGDQPLASVEAQAVTAFCLEIKPDVSIDVHGWRCVSYGDDELRQLFHELFGATLGVTNKTGMLFQWLQSEFGHASMLELPPFAKPQRERYVRETTQTMIEAIHIICTKP